MKKLITMILIASAMIFGVDGFRTILNPTNPISGDTAEAETWAISSQGNTTYASPSNGASVNIRR